MGTNTDYDYVYFNSTTDFSPQSFRPLSTYASNIPAREDLKINCGGPLLIRWQYKTLHLPNKIFECVLLICLEI